MVQAGLVSVDKFLNQTPSIRLKIIVAAWSGMTEQQQSK
jgi:hypothetical protein